MTDTDAEDAAVTSEETVENSTGPGEPDLVLDATAEPAEPDAPAETELGGWALDEEVIPVESPYDRPGRWYVVHLGAVSRSAAEGIVDDPESGPGVPAPSATC